jgi:putative ABC transport system permease protein
MESRGEEDSVIRYTDITSIMMSSVRTIIDSVSYVLIAFVAVSLVVSSIMIGIITYISVMERTKEIGVLRAIGARKKDVGRLFKAETVIIGFAAGIFGVGITYILSVPINLIINNYFPGQGLNSIANLNPLHAIALIAISVLLTLVSGWIPSKIAAKKDPVVALRTE